ncbi:MAG: methionine synthase [Thermodesulfobacteriota bacterium]
MNNTEILKNIADERILVMDGGMGTLIQGKDLTAKDYGGQAYEGCPEILNVTRPEIIREMHEAYFEAGADIVETNSFGGTDLVLSEYSLEHRMEELNKAAVKVAKEAAKKYSTLEKPRFVAGSMGPTNKAYSVTGGVTFDELEDNFFRQAKSLLSAGVDILILETQQDTVNVKAGLIGIEKAKKELSLDIPVALSVTIEATGTMLAGQEIDALYASVAHFNLFSIGLNCATGPEHMTDHIRTLSELSSSHLNICPNAGMPNEEGLYELGPDVFAKIIERFVDNGWVNLVGGCCGTTPNHIRMIADMVRGKKPKQPYDNKRLAISGINYLELTPDIKPVIVGERTNSIGSRKFKELIAGEKYEEASEIGRAQVKNGAQVIDICLADPERDEEADMTVFMDQILKKVKVPLMIDSTNSSTIECALKQTQGKSIINSINLEDGEDRFQSVVPLAKKYGASLVVGTIDEDPVQGMGITRKRKLAIAIRSYDLLVNKYGVEPEDIIFDPLVFPVGTGDENYVGSAEETIEGLRLIKNELPRVSTILGISNVSFGLPAAGREVLNAVYLYHATKAGLDFAIVNSQKLQRYASIPEEEKKLAEDILFFRGDDPIGQFNDFYKEKKVETKQPKSTLTPEQRLASYIVEGTKEGLVDDLNKVLKKTKAIDIVNGPLMKGMAEVGRLFNDNQLIVAEVLQSAEAMKAAVTHLEQFMEKGDTVSKGKILLATVKGDVHDIGKNLVDIILSNNGYQVVNLGIKVLSEILIDAQKREAADAIGLSGLLVKSAHQMVNTVEDFKNAGISVPVLVGGAALTRRFTDTKIQPAYEGPVLYAKDAMDGLMIADKVTNPETREDFLSGRQIHKISVSTMTVDPKGETEQIETKLVKLSNTHSIPAIPFNEVRIETGYDLEELFSYINPKMLFGKHLGLKGNPKKLVAKGDKKAKELVAFIDSFQKEIMKENMIKPRTICRFYPAVSDGESIILYDPEDPERKVETFNFPRQVGKERRCLSDYLPTKSNEQKDSIALFVVTAGDGVSRIAQRLKENGEYLKSHSISAIALETAEALAEYLHKQIREWWGSPDIEGITNEDLFKAKYRGRRYSFGYPACPDLSDQKKLFDLLKPERIGVKLTEGFMMDPEASVSAIVFHHPEAKYFSVS